MIRLSILVPAIGEQASIDATLLSVLENRPANCEIIVPCSASYQDPYDLGDEVRFIHCPDDSPVSVLLNSGLSNSLSERVHWLTPGILATDGWTESPVRSIGERKSGFVAPLILDESNSSRIESAGIRYTRGGARKTIGRNVRHPSRKSVRLRADGPSQHAGFCRRECLIGIGGFRAAFGPNLADADLAARIKAKGETCLVDTSSTLLVDSESVLTPLRRKGFRFGRESERLYWQHFRTNGALSSVIHLAHVAVETLKQFPSPATVTSLFGRFVGVIDSLRRIDDEGEGISVPAETANRTVRRAA